jgi:hypothetical protein
MSPENPRDRSRSEPIETFEEKWSRRAALAVAAGGLVTAGALLILGFEAQRRQSGQNDAGKLPYREFLEQFLESRMRSAYRFYPQFRTRQLSETCKRRLIEDFKRSPLYDKIARDTVRWFEENRRLGLVAKDDLSEKLELGKFLSIPRVEIKDAAFMANLRNTPEGRLLVRTFPRFRLSQDGSSLVVSHGFVLAHSDCFRNIPMQAITEVDVSRVSEEEQSIFLGVRSRGSPPKSR